MHKRDYAQTMLSNCKCGALAKYQYRIPLHWVECSRGGLCPFHLHTQAYKDSDGSVFDPEARDYAFDEWNRMVQK